MEGMSTRSKVDKMHVKALAKMDVNDEYKMLEKPVRIVEEVEVSESDILKNQAVSLKQGQALSQVAVQLVPEGESSSANLQDAKTNKYPKISKTYRNAKKSPGQVSSIQGMDEFKQRSTKISIDKLDEMLTLPSTMDLLHARNDKYKRKLGMWQCWTHEEEVFLVGAVMHRFFSRGSLSSMKVAKPSSSSSGGKRKVSAELSSDEGFDYDQKDNNDGEKSCWDMIKKSYDHCWARYKELNRDVVVPPSRTEHALSRHYKVMKEKYMSKLASNPPDDPDNFRRLYVEFQKSYNFNGQLIAELSNTMNFNGSSGFVVASFEKSGAERSDVAQAVEALESSEDKPRGRWNYVDEIILIGVVMETFFQQGSLSSSHKDRKSAEPDFWNNVFVVFQAVRKMIKQALKDQNKLGRDLDTQVGKKGKIRRTAQALGRHFKVMKVKLLESNGALTFKNYYDEWEAKYRGFYVQYLRSSNSQVTMDLLALDVPENNKKQKRSKERKTKNSQPLLNAAAQSSNFQMWNSFPLQSLNAMQLQNLNLQLLNALHLTNTNAIKSLPNYVLNNINVRNVEVQEDSFLNSNISKALDELQKLDLEHLDADKLKEALKKLDELKKVVDNHSNLTLRPAEKKLRVSN